MTDSPPSRLAQTGRDAVYAAERRAMALLDQTKRTSEQKTTEVRERSERVAKDRVADIRGVTDRLIDQARSLSRQADSIIAEIDDAITRVRSSPEEEASATAEQPAPERDPSPVDVQPDPPVRASGEPELPPAVARERNEPPSAGARLLAMQMAASGSSRQEIEDRLRNEFEVSQAAEIAASVLGDDA